MPKNVIKKKIERKMATFKIHISYKIEMLCEIFPCYIIINAIHKLHNK